jgi:hypothetical protein
LLGDPAVLGGLTAGLPHPRVEAEVADQPLRRAEPTEVADRGHDRQRHGGVHPWDRQQPAHLGVLEGDPAELGVDDAQLRPVKVELAQQRPDGLLLVWGQVLGGQPRPAFVAEQVGGWAARDEVAVQDRLDLVLQPGPLPHDVGAAGDLAAQREGGLIGQPHRRQELGRQQPSQHRRLDLVGGDLRLGDRAGLLRVGDHHPTDVAFQQPRDRVGVAGRLDRDRVAGAQAGGEVPQPLRRQLDPSDLAHHAALPDGDLSELTVDIQPDTAAHPVLPSPACGGRTGGQTTPTDPRSRRIRAGRRGGHVLPRARSPSNDHRPAQPAFAPGCPCPGRSHRTPRPTGTNRQPIRGARQHPPSFIPVTNPIESTFAPVRARTRVTKGPGTTDTGLAMVFKLLQAAQGRWRAVNAAHLVALIRAGARFERGKLIERPKEARQEKIDKAAA